MSPVLNEPLHEPSPDPAAQRARDRARFQRALRISLGFVLLLVLVFSAQPSFDWRAWAVEPHAAAGLLGLIGGPLLHGSFEHLATNAGALLLLGTLAGSVYPRATLAGLPLVWLGSGLGAWALGTAGSHHLGASGLTHGLMFLVFVLGLLRRDRAAIAAAMLAFLLYGGMLLTILPHEPGVSWQSHLGGALGGLAGAFAFRRLDPALPRKRYSWEIEEELAAAANPDAELEPPPPQDVPVLWHRPELPRGTVLKFPPRPGGQPHEPE